MLTEVDVLFIYIFSHDRNRAAWVFACVVTEGLCLHLQHRWAMLGEYPRHTARHQGTKGPLLACECVVTRLRGW